MKTRNILAVGIAALALSSCSTITHTSHTAGVDTQIYNLTVADMSVVAKKDSMTVDWKWNPLSTVSLSAQKETATHNLLSKSDADVLVEPEYIVNRRGIFRGGSVTVIGYPATYTNFRTMTKEDAEKLALIEGNGSTVVVSPVLSTTAGKAVKKKKSRTFGSSKEPVHHQFINLIGGVSVSIAEDFAIEDPAYHLGLMYGSYGKSWGWYGKLGLNIVEDDDGDKVKAPSLTFGAIKTIYGGFSAFFGAGVGGYINEDYNGSDYELESDFSIPVEAGFNLRIKSFNVMAGATYVPPISGSGSGNINPFLGVGYSF